MINRQASLFQKYNPKVQAALDYDKQNPIVWTMFQRFALKVVDRKRKHFSAKAVWERMRWYIEVETHGDDFKLNNNYHAYYARKFLSFYPSCSELFQLRSSVYDGLFKGV